MTRFITCGLTVLFCAAALAFAPSARAEDGVVLINQSTSMTGLPGCSHSGFPITICSPGSYRLSGNLTIPDANTNGIVITSDSVTLDLNGFTISGPVTCTRSESLVVSCSQSGSGYGIFAQNSFITVRNGSIHGMGNDGILLGGSGELIDEIRAFSNGSSGIVASDGLVTRCIGYLNGVAGIGGGFATNVTFSEAAENAGDGIEQASLVSNNLVYANDGDGIASALVAIGNVTLENLGYGMRLQSGDGFLANWMNSYGGYVTGGTSMGHNLAGTSVF